MCVCLAQSFESFVLNRYYLGTEMKNLKGKYEDEVLMNRAKRGRVGKRVIPQWVHSSEQGEEDSLWCGS